MQEQALLLYVIGCRACVGLVYYAGLVCNAWPFLQLQLQPPPPPSAHDSPPPPPPRTRPYHWAGAGGGGGWERQTPDQIWLLWSFIPQCLTRQTLTAPPCGQQSDACKTATYPEPRNAVPQQRGQCFHCDAQRLFVARTALGWPQPPASQVRILDVAVLEGPSDPNVEWLWLRISASSKCILPGPAIGYGVG